MIKQVIIIRSDLKNHTTGHKVRTGKIVAQACHASMQFLLDRLVDHDNDVMFTLNPKPFELSPDIWEWIYSNYTKIVLKVNSEEELLKLFQRALDKGLEAHIITDIGNTEFNKVPTKTCLAIGPNESSDIDEITKNLELL